MRHQPSQRLLIGMIGVLLAASAAYGNNLRASLQQVGLSNGFPFADGFPFSNGITLPAMNLNFPEGSDSTSNFVNAGTSTSTTYVSTRPGYGITSTTASGYSNGPDGPKSFSYSTSDGADDTSGETIGERTPDTNAPLTSSTSPFESSENTENTESSTATETSNAGSSIVPYDNQGFLAEEASESTAPLTMSTAPEESSENTEATESSETSENDFKCNLPGAYICQDSDRNIDVATQCSNAGYQSCVCYNNGTCVNQLANKCVTCADPTVVSVFEGGECPTDCTKDAVAEQGEITASEETTNQEQTVTAEQEQTVTDEQGRSLEQDQTATTQAVDQEQAGNEQSVSAIGDNNATASQNQTAVPEQAETTEQDQAEISEQEQSVTAEQEQTEQNRSLDQDNIATEQTVNQEQDHVNPTETSTAEQTVNTEGTEMTNSP